jgi:transposase
MTELFGAALGITEPIYLESIELEEEALHLYLKFRRGAEFPCPVCGVSHKVYDTEDKVWQHLNFFQYRSFLHFPVPRVNCPACGKHRFVPAWTRPSTGFTLMFEAFVTTLVKAGLPFTKLQKITGVYDTRLRRIVDYYVEKAYAEKDMSEVTSVGIDETSSKKGHKYITVFVDHKKREVIYCTPGKDGATVGKFSEELVNHGSNPLNINAVSMDMSLALQSGVAGFLPCATITFDRFHVMKMVNDAVDAVRRAEVKTNPILKKTRYSWVKNRENLTDKQKEILQNLENENLQTAAAYRLRCTLQDIYTFAPTKEKADFLLEGWLNMAQKSELPPFQKLAKTVHENRGGILKFFESHLTAGLSECLNSIIGNAKRIARGYANINHFINIIYLRCAGLNLPAYPIRG